jgi:hypothetical protein
MLTRQPRRAFSIALARQVGLQMNYNKLCACVAEDAIHPNFEHSLGQVQLRLRSSVAMTASVSFISPQV